jgi:N-acetylglutamate synthase-like GNAT family acetyltransferase
MSEVKIRRAVAEDQATIRRMIREEQLDPTALRWQHFVVAEREGEIVGIGQIRPYRRCRELGSLVVREDMRGQGLGGQIIRALLEGETEAVYLECLTSMAPYYQRFGFATIPWWRAPMPLKLKAAFNKIVWWPLGYRFVVMRRG